MILNELAKKDKYWRSIAFNICKDKDLAKDLVQDMYLKVYDISQKRTLEINDYYIVIIMRNLFIDYCKQNNINIRIDDLYYLESNCNKFEPSDTEYKALNELSFLERELLTLNQTMSYHEIQRQFNINYQFARRIILNVKERNGKKSNK
jgi:DNA-directed RNA polymerase specialized sigma24 family protein